MFLWKHTNVRSISWEIIVSTTCTFLLFIIWMIGASVTLNLFDSSQTNEILGICFTIIFLIIALAIPCLIGYKTFVFAKKSGDKELLLMSYLQMTPLAITQLIAIGFAIKRIINLNSNNTTTTKKFLNFEFKKSNSKI